MGSSGFALGFIFLSPPFSPIRFFCAIFLNLEQDFWPFVAKKKSQVLRHFLQKSLLSLTPLILVDYSTHIDTNYGTVHFVFKVVDSHLIDQCIFVPEGVNFPQKTEQTTVWVFTVC